MAGDWIKAGLTTPDKPEVVKLAEILHMDDPDFVLGKLWRFWAWADANTQDGVLKTKYAHIDRVVYCPGFARGLVSVGWLQGREGALVIPNFDRHNGNSSKARALEAEAKRIRRSLKDQSDNVSDVESDKCPTPCPTVVRHNVGPEKRREENKQENNAGGYNTVVCSEPPTAPASPEMEDQHSEKRTERPLPARFGANAVICAPGTRNGQQGASQASTGPCLERERLNDVRGMRCADNHADLGTSPGAARFMAACLAINPSWSRTLPTAIERAAALEAYRSAQGRVTPRDMEMLKAYYASSLTHDRSNKAFWRPDSRRKFWECFGDVLTHADRWAKETRWKPAAARKKPKPEQAPQQPEGPVVDIADAVAEIASLREEMGLGG